MNRGRERVCAKPGALRASGHHQSGVSDIDAWKQVSCPILQMASRMLCEECLSLNSGLAGRVTMGGPIISGGKPWQEALFLVAFVSLLFVPMSPELTSMLLRHVPWLAPVLDWLHRVLD